MPSSTRPCPLANGSVDLSLLQIHDKFICDDYLRSTDAMAHKNSITWSPNAPFEGPHGSPEYTPCSGVWLATAGAGGPCTHGPEWAETTPAGQAEIVFGLGAKDNLAGPGTGTEEEEDTNRAFVKLLEPVLCNTPELPPHTKQCAAPSAVPEPRPRSARQAAKKCPIPVAKRVQ